MFDWIVFASAAFGWFVIAAGLGYLAGNMSRKHSARHVAPMESNPIVATQTGRRYRLVRRNGIHAVGKSLDGEGIMCFTEHSVAPEFRQIVHDYIYTQPDAKKVV